MFPTHLPQADTQKVLLVTGPLGAGKTTLINSLLKTPGMLSDSRIVIVNDAGAIGIDARRFDVEAGQLQALNTGCVCCTDLASLVSGVKSAVASGTKSIIIEPTGIADASVIKDRISSIAGVNNSLSVMTVCVFDVANFNANLVLSRKGQSHGGDGFIAGQVKSADLIVLTKLPISNEAIELKAFDSVPKDVFSFIQRHNSSARVFAAKSDGSIIGTQFAAQLDLAMAVVPKISPALFQDRFGSSGVRAGQDLIRGKGHHHVHSHDHLHAHGVFPGSFALSSNTKLEDLLIALKPLCDEGVLARAKGEIDGNAFDIVWGRAAQTQVTRRSPTLAPGQSFVTVLLTEKREVRGLLTPLLSNQPIEAPVKFTQAELEAAVQHQLSQFPDTNKLEDGRLVVHCDADRVYDLLLDERLPGELRRDGLEKLISWRLRSLSDIRRGHYADPNGELNYWKVQLAGGLAWYGAKHSEQISPAVFKLLCDSDPVNLMFDTLREMRSSNEVSAAISPADKWLIPIVQWWRSHVKIGEQDVRSALSNLHNLKASEAVAVEGWNPSVIDNFVNAIFKA